jgi:hypothetical protein
MYHQRSLGFIPLCTLALGVTISAFRRRAVFMLAGFLAYELAIVFNVNRFLFRISCTLFWQLSSRAGRSIRDLLWLL